MSRNELQNVYKNLYSSGDFVMFKVNLGFRTDDILKIPQ